VVKYLKQYELFYKKASVDFKAALNLYEDFQKGDIELDLEIIFFHLQQSAEKLLKALLSFKEINFPKIHDLEELLNLIHQNNINLQTNNEKLTDLGDYAVEGRYSIIHDDFEDAKEYFNIISTLKSDIENIIFQKSSNIGNI
jgi:HEPN domain-containing protein